MQNTSHAVMAQRIEPHDSLDDFPTQPWGVRALIEHALIPELGITGRNDIAMSSVWEPACNRGHMAKALEEYFGLVIQSDVHQYGNNAVRDFLFPDAAVDHDPHWIITNPPFRLAEQFIERACGLARVGVAMLVRTSFLEGVGRYERLFKSRPPTIVAQFVERLPMVKGRLTATGSTATAYCWLVWMHGKAPRPMAWIPPCRRKLERDGDYLP